MLPELCLAALALAPCAAPRPVQNPPQKTAPLEVFEKTDPYTRGGKEELAKAGLESLGPFHWADGIETKDIEEILGQRVLWAETAHFKIGSTLPTYDRPSDSIEQEKLKQELTRLAKRLPRVRRDAPKLDPWLRLHLYAQRAEEQYAAFEARFGLHEEDFEPAPAGAAPKEDLGPGRYLGQPLKYTLLLTNRSTDLARFAKRWLELPEQGFYRALLPGGSWFAGCSAQATKDIGSELDSALHALVAYAVAVDLCEGFRGTKRPGPLWFKHGLGLCASRAVDERWSIFVERIEKGSESDAGRWDTRLRALVENNYVDGWEAMLAWPDELQLAPHQHMSAWSRVDWLLAQEKADLRAFLIRLREPPAEAGGWSSKDPPPLEPQKTALQAGFGRSPAQLDEAWRKWVLRKYPRR